MARPERVGQFEMTVAIAEPSPEVAPRWARRAETLAAWLLSEWLRECAENTGSTTATSRSEKEADAAPPFVGGQP
jgi:hypothetical protein